MEAAGKRGGASMTPMPIYNSIARGRAVVSDSSSFGRQDMIEAEVQMIEKAIKFDITNAYEIYRDCKKDYITESEYPYCIPPWPYCWLEYRTGGKMWFKGNLVDVASTKCGAFVVHANLRKYAGPRRDELLTQVFQAMASRYATPDQELFTSAHMIVIHPWQHPQGIAAPSDLRLFCYIGDDGLLVRWQCAVGMDCKHLIESGVSKDDIAGLIHPPLFAFSLANCKNVVQEKQDAYFKCEGSKKKAKKFYRYHVLKIAGSMTGGNPAGSGQDESKKAMHLCRGHFAKYTDDSPLFGKYTGLFWKPMHVRGKVQHGIVDKDYAIKT
jgi:hypothetical protein